MVKLITFQGRRAWLKEYGNHHRGGALRLLDGVANRLHATALKPPPYYSGEQAKQTEMRRLAELRAQGVHVPEMLGHGKAVLILDDNGPSLGACMREAANDSVRLDELTASAVDAILHAHRDGACFGQPVPRNITFDGERVGFIDFEEDPLEVMALEHAQARDWLMFTYSTARYYDDRPQDFSAILKRAIGTESQAVSAHAHQVADRLRKLARFSLRLGSSARTLAHSIFILHAATSFVLALSVILLIDWIGDGDLDLLWMLV